MVFGCIWGQCYAVEFLHDVCEIPMCVSRYKQKWMNFRLKEWLFQTNWNNWKLEAMNFWFWFSIYCVICVRSRIFVDTKYQPVCVAAFVVLLVTWCYFRLWWFSQIIWDAWNVFFLNKIKHKMHWLIIVCLFPQFWSLTWNQCFLETFCTTLIAWQYFQYFMIRLPGCIVACFETNMFPAVCCWQSPFAGGTVKAVAVAKVGKIVPYCLMYTNKLWRFTASSKCRVFTCATLPVEIAKWQFM